MPMDVVDYEIKGSEMQFVEIELDPGEAAVGEARSMMFMDAGIAMDTVFGDRSAGEGGFLAEVLGAGKTRPTRENVLTHAFTHKNHTKPRLPLAPAEPRDNPPTDPA